MDCARLRSYLGDPSTDCTILLALCNAVVAFISAAGRVSFIADWLVVLLLAAYLYCARIVLPVDRISAFVFRALRAL